MTFSRVRSREYEDVPPKPRDTRAGIFHIYTHCVWAVPKLYRDDVDRLEFLRRVAAAARPGWTCLQYVLMGTHYHLMAHVEDGVLPRAMHWINLGYARYHNRRYALRGHVQYWRYGARRIEDDTDLIRTYAYIANKSRRSRVVLLAGRLAVEQLRRHGRDCGAGFVRRPGAGIGVLQLASGSAGGTARGG